jgi:hypothetical protein
MKKWYDKGLLIALACFIFPPLGIYALWKSTSIERNGKIVFGVVTMGWFLLPFWATNEVEEIKKDLAVADTTTKVEVQSGGSLYASKEDSIKAYNEALKAVQSSNKLFETLSQVENLRSNLSNIGIGELGVWAKPDVNGEYMSITKYYEFGNPNDNLRKNNIAIYLTSNIPDEVEKVELDMRVNNIKEEKKAVKFFTENSKKVLKLLGLNYTEKNQEKDGYTIVNTVQKGKVNQYTLTIEKKP